MNMKYLIENDQMYIDGSKAWFVDRNTNELMTMDIDTGKCTYKVQIPVKDGNAFRCTPSICADGQKIFLLPDKGKEVWLFDSGEEKLYKVEVTNEKEVEIRTIAKWVYKERLYFVSLGLRKLVVIDIGTGKMIKTIDIFDKIKEFSHGFEMIGNVVYLASATTNTILELDLENESVKYHTVPEMSGGIGTICFDGKTFLLTGCERKIYKWNKENNTVIVFENFPDDFIIYDRINTPVRIYNTEQVMPFPIFQKGILLRNRILYIPWNMPQVYADKLICMNLQDNKISTIMITDNNKNVTYSYEYIRDNIYIGVLSSENKYITEVNVETWETERKEMYVDEECLEIKHKNENVRQGYYSELVQEDINYLIKKTIVQKVSEGHLEDNIGSRVFRSTIG